MKKILLFSLCAFFSLNLAAKEIKMAIGLSLPPYVITENNSGLEVDLVRAALAVKGHTFAPVYVPFARVAPTIEQKQADGALTVTESSGLTAVFYSESHITYQNMAMSLKDANLTIKNVGDLKGKSMAAFQNAKIYLGADFKKIADENGSSYNEIANQENQVAMLFIGRAQVAIADINIFKYFKERVKNADTSKEYVLHEIFAPTNYKVAFSDKQVRDDFNAGLKEIKANGQYQKIFSQYIK